MWGTGIEKVPSLPKCRVPVLISAQLSEVSGINIEKSPNLPKCGLPTLNKYQTFRIVRQGIETSTKQYRYPGRVVEGIPVPGVYLGRRTGLTEVSDTGIEKVPNLPKCWVPILKKYRTYRSVRYRSRKKYRTYRSVGYRYRGRTGLILVPPLL